jgi:hypothetical protein
MTDLSAPLRHRQCHLPLAPLEPEQDDEENLHHVRLLEEEEGVPRVSAEELAWRSS